MQAVWLELEAAGGSGYLSESETARAGCGRRRSFLSKARVWSSYERSWRSMRRLTAREIAALGAGEGGAS